MEGEGEVRGEEVRGELEASGEGYRQAACALQQVWGRKGEQGRALEMTVWTDSSSPAVSGREESCLPVENVTEEKRREMGEENVESTAKRTREGKEEDEKEESLTKRKREGEEEDEKEESLAKRKREKEEDKEEDDEWYIVDRSQVPPPDEVKEQPKRQRKAKPTRQGRRKEKDSSQTVDIPFTYPIPPGGSVTPKLFWTQDKLQLKAGVGFKGETAVVRVSSQSRAPAGLPWSIRVELVHPKEAHQPWVREEVGQYGGARGETLCSVEIPKTDLEQFVHSGMVCIHVHYC